MQLHGRNPEFGLRPADVRLLQFELPLSGTNIPGEEVFQNRFSRNMHEAVPRGTRSHAEITVQTRSGPSSVAERGMARHIDREIRQRVPSDKASKRYRRFE